MKDNPNPKIGEQVEPKISWKREKQLRELDRIAKLLVRRDLKLSETLTKLEEQRDELDRITKMLTKRDLRLSKIREEREKELGQLEERTEALEKSRRALMNILEDFKQARNRAETEKRKTQAIIHNLTDGILLFDVENRLAMINPRVEIFFEIKQEQVIGQDISELEKFPKLKKLLDFLKGRPGTISRAELEIEENLVLEVSSLPVTKPEGEKVGTLIILHDITREKRIERMKTEFVSLAAHQLRTPLSAIKWTLKMLLDGDLGELTKEQHEFLQKTYRSNERMINLINDLLNVTRIEEGRYVYKTKFVRFGQLVESVIGRAKEEIKRKGIKFEFKKPEQKLPQVEVDTEKIRLAIKNLIDNAVRYTPSGGRVTVTLKCEEQAIKFAIKDTGIGIPEDQQDQIFTKFFRAENAIRTETEGTGLGLFITKNIIEAHGGKIWFESKVGKGTTFYFTIPVKKEEFEKFVEGF